MLARNHVARSTLVLLSLVLCLAPFVSAGPPAAAAPAALADPAFQHCWSHCDKPVQDGIAPRSWTWGPSGFYTAYEPYVEGPGGQHLVTYFDKSRMEINDPTGDRNAEWFVTNGLLVVDMISGRVQVGDQAFVQAAPAAIPVAGDTATSGEAPTYAALAAVASLQNDHRAPDRTGQPIRESLNRWGTVGSLDNLAGYSRYAAYDPTLGHNIPDVFWQFMNQRGTTYHDTGYVQNDLVVDWLFAMGYPLTEPYWIRIHVGTQDHWVLMQAFQRRILTYAPDNPPGWQVEMGNAGRAYFDWRYGGAAVLPTATAVPTPVPAPGARITLDPAQGGAATVITINGRYFPAYAAVVLGLEKPAAGYARTLATVGSDAHGAFTTRVTLPDDAALLGDVTVTAKANGGAIRAAQTFRLTYAPEVHVSPATVVPNGVIRVWGSGFPAATAVHLGLVFPHNGATTWLNWAQTSRQGAFDVNLGIGSQPSGAQFTVVAVATGGVKAGSAEHVTVVGQPTLQITPDRGPVAVNVTLSGAGWPPNRNIGIGFHGATAQAEVWPGIGAVTDSAGRFSVAVWIRPELAAFSEVHLVALEPVSQLRVEGRYYVTQPVAPTPTPGPPVAPTLAITPTQLVAGQLATINGSHWPAGALVTLGLGRSGVEESLGTAAPDAAGRFTRQFTVSARWANAGPLILVAAVPNGPSATTGLWVGAATPRIVPGGLPLQVIRLQGTDGKVSYRVRGSGWSAGKTVVVSVFSADGTLDVPVAAPPAPVAAAGTFQVTWAPDAGWAGRSDLGIRAITTDGTQASIRYLPWAMLSKTAQGGTFQIQGVGWPGVVGLCAEMHRPGAPDTELGRVTTDGTGAFRLTLALPRVPDNPRNSIEICTPDEVYSAQFGF